MPSYYSVVPTVLRCPVRPCSNLLLVLSTPAIYSSGISQFYQYHEKYHPATHCQRRLRLTSPQLPRKWKAGLRKLRRMGVSSFFQLSVKLTSVYHVPLANLPFGVPTGKGSSLKWRIRALLVLSGTASQQLPKPASSQPDPPNSCAANIVFHLIIIMLPFFSLPDSSLRQQ
ncbi:hypothetical protein EJ08DRAFT_212725 [Tothia fuscella]|uniref:Uncharacterized protein n=1 Tax=Tothia fuscella TaxID=1048955 RepID=A0A9P4TXY4_9PEZI|nr:hypothetical protein EJ08DRAFT_212725 [Tothia fuscella]